MKKPAHTPTKSTSGDAQPQAHRAERQDARRQDEPHECQDTRQVGRRDDQGSL
jgi:hypothetical protein